MKVFGALVFLALGLFAMYALVLNKTTVTDLWENEVDLGSMVRTQLPSINIGGSSCRPFTLYNKQTGDKLDSHELDRWEKPIGSGCDKYHIVEMQTARGGDWGVRSWNTVTVRVVVPEGTGITLVTSIWSKIAGLFILAVVIGVEILLIIT